MAQATGIQALGRAAQLLHEPKYDATARRALGAFTTAPPTGVRTTGPRGGVAYLQYSFAPRLYIFNAFLQSLIGLYDFSNLTGDARARACTPTPIDEARAEVPYSDVGDWSLYNYAGHEVEPRLPRAAARVPGEPLHAQAGRRVLRVREEVPRLPGRPAHGRLRAGPATATEDQPVALRFSVSKLSAVQVTVTRPDGRVGVRPARDLPARHRRVHLDAEGAVHLHRARRREGAAHRPRQARQRHGGRGGGEPAGISRLPVRRLMGRARSSTRERAESARRASRPPPRAAAPTRASGPSSSPPIPPTACPTRSRRSSAPSPRT